MKILAFAKHLLPLVLAVAMRASPNDPSSVQDSPNTAVTITLVGVDGAIGETQHITPKKNGSLAIEVGNDTFVDFKPLISGIQSFSSRKMQYSVFSKDLQAIGEPVPGSTYTLTLVKVEQKEVEHSAVEIPRHCMHCRFCSGENGLVPMEDAPGAFVSIHQRFSCWACLGFYNTFRY